MPSFQLFEPLPALAPYASNPADSKGRLFREPQSRTRSAFARDRDRILHSNAWRRLIHKTQVFVYHEGDHYRTRLTHSLEVAQIARSLARQLGLSEDLAEAIALSHDLGHPPFGHAGEDALNRCMASFGGFDHNAQALRLVTKLEQRYASFDGLNLSWETLEGLVKHNGPLVGERVAAPIRNFDQTFALDLGCFAGLEAQVAAIADDIAYNAHDIDDGLRAGLFDVRDLTDIGLIAAIADDVNTRYGSLSPPRMHHEIVRRVINVFVEDVLSVTKANLLALAPQSAADIRAAAQAVVGLSDAARSDEMQLRGFLREKMYGHARVQRMSAQAQRVISALFETFINRPAAMPSSWAAIAEAGEPVISARAVADYVAGMTDRYAISEYHRHIGPLAIDL
ncbi:MAG: deoxyguanosinetriphosphate triphosphohydrolase [Pseudomonadota bacterium]